MDTIAAWRQQKEDNLRRDDGWLTLAGLFWLQDGENSVGSDPASQIALPESAPQHLGVISFDGQTATIKTNEPVVLDGQQVTTATLRDDHAEGGPSLVTTGSITFYVISRSDAYAIRVRDTN